MKFKNVNWNQSLKTSTLLNYTNKNIQYIFLSLTFPLILYIL